MFDDSSGDESAESTPEDDLEFDALDAESELGPDPPEPPEPPEPPSAPEPPEVGDLPPASAASKELQSMFWRVVVLLNLAILAASLGAMFVVFRGRLRFGGGLMLAGALGIAHAYRIYRHYEYG